MRTTVAASDPSLPAPANSAGPTKTVVKKLTILETILQILQKDGIGAFWSGIGPALVLVSNPVLQFSLFEQLKNKILASRVGGPGLTDLEFFWLGAVSKLFATTITYPYLTVKARMQAGSSGHQYNSTLDGLQQTIASEGVAGLYRGIVSKLIQSVATAAILFVSQPANGCKPRPTLVGANLRGFDS